MTLLSCTCAVAEEDEFRCLVSIGVKKPIRLQFVFPPDSSDLGKVIYQGGSGAIQVKRKSERTIEEAPNGRPWQFESVWEEITKDGIGGTYSSTCEKRMARSSSLKTSRVPMATMAAIGMARTNDL